jgi:hypothetical protein
MRNFVFLQILYRKYQIKYGMACFYLDTSPRAIFYSYFQSLDGQTNLTLGVATNKRVVVKKNSFSK